MIAREGLQEPLRMADPDGNRVQLVPPGQDGVSQIAVVMAVRDLSARRRFYRDILGFVREGLAPITLGDVDADFDDP
jgi:catechol 2,3-dioxygenase-like lactoylglutathione lyase family enzyme